MVSGKSNVVSLTPIPSSGTDPGAAVPKDRRASRRAATQAEIVSAAWDLVRTQGLAGLSMRDLGDRVGMRAQSVYGYFASKDAIYDAMFRQGFEQYLAWMGSMDGSRAADPVDGLRALAHRFFGFCTSDPVRYQLMFQRTIPGFEPSPASYALAVEALALMQADLARTGMSDPEASDLATAVFTGLVSQQLANDPGGDRWQRLVDRAVVMVVREIAPRLLDVHTPTTKPRSPR